MKNLKITLHLSGAVILNRFTTIDSILLSAYYGYMAKKGKRFAFDPEHKSVDWIQRKAGIMSGSIWYIEPDSKFLLDFNWYCKKVDVRKHFENTDNGRNGERGGKIGSNKLYKGAYKNDETMTVDKIHFYIRAKKEFVEALLFEEVSSIGKKQKIGFGSLSSFSVEEMEEDKGFMLNETTPSKPLPVSEFTVKSKKIAFFRRNAPYWTALTEGTEACYMPTTSLLEFTDNSYSNDDFSVSKDISFISSMRFLYEQAKRIEKKNFTEANIDKAFSAKKVPSDYAYKEGGEMRRCLFSGELSNTGIYGSMASFFRKWKASFSDFDGVKVSNTDFISKESLWCLSNISSLGYILIEQKSKEWKIIRGNSADKKNLLHTFLTNHKKLHPPFFMGIKDTQNQQHISFYGTVSISNAFYFVQYGHKRLMIDVEMLNSAIKDIARITKKYAFIKKTHLVQDFNSGMPVNIQTEHISEAEPILSSFQKKYDSDLRFYLNVVAF